MEKNFLNKKQGIGYNLTDEQLKERFNSVKASTLPIKNFDSMANSYTSLISADNEEERFGEFLEFYLNEPRSKESTRANTDKGKRKVLKRSNRCLKKKKLKIQLLL